MDEAFHLAVIKSQIAATVAWHKNQYETDQNYRALVDKHTAEYERLFNGPNPSNHHA